MRAPASASLTGERAERTGAAARLPLWVWAASLGPGLIGMLADNDAGSMLSYLQTGASHGLLWVLPTMLAWSAPTFFLLWLASRTAQVTSRPYSRILASSVGGTAAAVEAIVLYSLNGFTMVTEFVGMRLALGLAGIGATAAVSLTWALVAAVTSGRLYRRTERTLLYASVATVCFVPALLLAHRPAGAWSRAFATRADHPLFLLLALAGNQLPPWMIYWQQNATWAGEHQRPQEVRADILTGTIAMNVMAVAVVLLGASIPGGPDAAQPLQWLAGTAGRASAAFFAVGLGTAGLLAACTVSLSSLWTLREAFAARPAEDARLAGGWRWLHLCTLAAAAAVGALPQLLPGAVALWANAAAAVWMPVSLLLLLTVVHRHHVAGTGRRAFWVYAALSALAGLYAALAVAGLW